MSRTSSHLRNALVSVSRTYVIMHDDDDDEAVSVLRTPPRTDLYASGRDKVIGPSQICMNEYYMVPLRRIPRTSASALTL